MARTSAPARQFAENAAARRQPAAHEGVRDGGAALDQQRRLHSRASPAAMRAWTSACAGSARLARHAPARRRSRGTGRRPRPARAPARHALEVRAAARAHVQRHDVARAFPDRIHRRLAVQPGHGTVFHVAVAAPGLQALGHRRHGALADQSLATGGVPTRASARAGSARSSTRAPAATPAPWTPRSPAPGRPARCASAAARPASLPKAWR